MNNKMDKLCSNCGRRFGRHYSAKKVSGFCNYIIYMQYVETGKVDSSKIFIDSGERKTMEGKKYSIKDPNSLFKRKKV